MNYDNLDYTEKEFLTIPKVLAKQIKDAESDEAVTERIKQYIKSIGVNIDEEVAQMDEDILKFKLIASQYKNTLKKIADDQAVELDTVWDKMEDTNKKLRDKYSEIAMVMEPIRTTYREIVDMSNRLDSYAIDRVDKVFRFINGLTEEDISRLESFVNKNKKDSE